jgi:hypothetical protein
MSKEKDAFSHAVERHLTAMLLHMNPLGSRDDAERIARALVVPREKKRKSKKA